MSSEYVEKKEAIRLIPSLWVTKVELMSGVLVMCDRCKRKFVVVSDESAVVSVCPYMGCEMRSVFQVSNDVKVIG